jgi:hypothetical protein
MTKYLFTFGFNNAAKVLNESMDDEPFASVYAATYDKAVKKILKLKLPHVNSEEDLKFNSCQEEIDDELEQTEEKV